MSKNYYIADTHFDHDAIISFDNRPFLFGAEEMNAALIKNWNGVVGKDDTVYILGDFCWSTADRWIEILKQLNGNKELILGNHEALMLTCSFLFDEVSEENLDNLTIKEISLVQNWIDNGGGPTLKGLQR